MSASDDQIKSLPGAEVTGAQFAGYVPVSLTAADETDSDETQLFYWLAGPSEDLASKPVVLWTNGGPGSPSFWGVFTENGPYSISDPDNDPDWPTLTPREKAWNNYVNYLVIEHPLGCSLSFDGGPDPSNTSSNAPQTPEAGSDQYYAALLNVLRRHGLTDAPLVISGESYAGTYLPLLAQRIVDGGELTNFQGVVLGDAWVDPETQLKHDTKYALDNELITPDQKNALDAAFTVYTDPFNGLTSNETTPAAKAWVKAFLGGVSSTGLSLYGLGTAIQQLWGHNDGITDPYMTNIGHPKGKDPDFSRVLKYINLPEVRAALHVPDGMPDVSGWGGSNTAWNNWNQSRSVVSIVQDLLDNNPDLKVLVLSGLNDAKDCNWLGTQGWLMNSLQNSPSVDQFRASTPVPWHTGQNGDGPKGGTEQGTGRLRWLKIDNAGHMAVMDQPDLIFYITSRIDQ